MSIYKGDKLVSGILGPTGLPGVNSSGGSDVGSVIINILPGAWQKLGDEYIRTITANEHKMSASAALLVYTAIYNESYTALEKLDCQSDVSDDGTVVLHSNTAWEGICVIAGGISQATDAVARKAIDDEQNRAQGAEAALNAAITSESQRAQGAEEATLNSAKDYADRKIAETVAASQRWLPAVSAFANLPAIVDTSTTYLCRVIADNDVYQCVAGQTSWSKYSDNTDYIDEEELSDAIELERQRAVNAEETLSGKIGLATAKFKCYKTEGTASAYTVNDEALGHEYVNGLTFEILPHIDSNEAPTLNVNGLGAAAFYVKSLSGATKRLFATLTEGASYIVSYSASDSGWVILNISYPDYADVEGAPPIYGSTGQSETGLMHQKAITEAINAVSVAASEALSAETERAQGVERSLDEALRLAQSTAAAKYTKPTDGIPTSDLDTAAQGALTKADTAVQPNDLAAVAKSGSYNDLNNKPASVSISKDSSGYWHINVG